jgi:hypothetical protein
MDNPAAWHSAPVVLPPDLPHELIATDKDSDAWKALADMEVEVLRLQESNPARERRVLFVCHQGDKPAQEQEYMSFHDVALDHIAIGRVDKECCTFERGWELLRIDGPKVELPGRRTTIKATYLTLGRVAQNATAWPENWVSYLFEPMGRPPPPGLVLKRGERPRFIPWTEEHFPVDCIEWSTEPKITKGKMELRIPTAVQRMAMNVVRAIESGMAIEAQMPQGGEGEDGDD